MAETTFKGATIAIVSAVLVAVVAATTQPWWWCKLNQCGAGEEPGPRMGELMMRTNLQGLDINNGEMVANAQACAQLCLERDECKAMTYVYRAPADTQNGTCWLKGSVPPAQLNDYMISSKKLPPGA